MKRKGQTTIAFRIDFSAREKQKRINLVKMAQNTTMMVIVGFIDPK